MFERKLAGKLRLPEFPADFGLLLAPGGDWKMDEARWRVSERLIALLPGDPRKGGVVRKEKPVPRPGEIAPAGNKNRESMRVGHPEYFVLCLRFPLRLPGGKVSELARLTGNFLAFRRMRGGASAIADQETHRIG